MSAHLILLILCILVFILGFAIGTGLWQKGDKG